MSGEGYFTGDEATGRESEYSAPSSEVNNAWSYTSIIIYVFIACFIN
jgi:hypothetical protein